MPRPYPAGFRRRALDLVATGRTVRDVAASLGIAESCLYRWKSQDLIDGGLKPGPTSSDSAELAAAHRRIRELEDEVKILRKTAAKVEDVMRPKARFQLVRELAAERVDVGRACRELAVSRSGFYEWRSRAPSARSIRHAWLTDTIAAVHAASAGTYGVPRVHAELVHAHGIKVGNTVAMLMRRATLCGLPLRRRARRVPPPSTVTDLVRRDFRRDGPNQLWVTDITYRSLPFAGRRLWAVEKGRSDTARPSGASPARAFFAARRRVSGAPRTADTASTSWLTKNRPAVGGAAQSLPRGVRPRPSAAWREA